MIGGDEGADEELESAEERLSVLRETGIGLDCLNSKTNEHGRLL